MSGMPTKLTRTVLQRAERVIDRRRPSETPGVSPLILPYRGFGRRLPSGVCEMLIRGRVVLDRQISRATSPESLWRNLLNTYRRFESDELVAVPVAATYRDAAVETATDEEGYFTARLETHVPEAPQIAHEVRLSLPGRGIEARGEVLVPMPDSELAIISDIDDTIVRTNATSLLGMVRSVIRNAATRLPFEGVGDLYQALQKGRNPIFYVSSSPWNLHELLSDFMQLNGIPHGPMFLQDWGIDETTLLMASHREHKLEQIQLLVGYYPSMQFVLIGDSGQHDPEIYLEVIRAHPGRIRAAFIRDVTSDPRDQAVAAIIEESRSAGVEMLYVKDSADALEQARRLELI